MTNDELLAQVDASYTIERARNEEVRQAAVMLGDKSVKYIFRLAWIIGNQAGLERAKSVMTTDKPGD